MCVAVALGVRPLDNPSDVGDNPVCALSVADTVPTLGLAGCAVRSDPVLYVEPVVTCGLVAGVVATGAACALVEVPAGDVVAGAGWALGTEPVLGAGWALETDPVLGAVPGAVWLAGPEAALGAPEVVPDPPVDCAMTWPGAGWPPEVWAFGPPAAVSGEPLLVPVSELRALTLPAV
jgi:hypothetical protein